MILPHALFLKKCTWEIINLLLINHQTIKKASTLLSKWGERRDWENKKEVSRLRHLNAKWERTWTMLSLLFLVLLTQSNLSISEQLPQNIFILAGQSNMAGRGGVVNNTKNGIPSWDGIVPVQCQPNPSILRLSASLTWVQAHEPLHADIDYNKTNGVGPGMSFANAILTKVPNFGSIGLVPCAIGGTSISEWAKGGFLYDQLVRRTQFALQRGGVIRAMLWYQGESDTQIREDADAYEGRLDRFFIDLRADLGYPTLPIIQVIKGYSFTYVWIASKHHAHHFKTWKLNLQLQSSPRNLGLLD